MSWDEDNVGLWLIKETKLYLREQNCIDETANLKIGSLTLFVTY